MQIPANSPLDSIHSIYRGESNDGALTKLALTETVQHIIRGDSLLFQDADVAFGANTKGRLMILTDESIHFDRLIPPLQRLCYAQLTEAYEEKNTASPIQYRHLPDFAKLQCPCIWFRSYRLLCKHLWRLTLEGWQLDDSVVKEMVDRLSDGYMSYYHGFNDPFQNPAFDEAQRAWAEEQRKQRALREAQTQFTLARDRWLAFPEHLRTLFYTAQDLAQQLPRGGAFMQALAAYLTYETLGGVAQIDPRRWALENGFLDIGRYPSA